MRDVRIKENASTYIIIEVDGLEIINRLKDYLPSDRVVTLDSNNNVYLYDKCFAVNEEDIEGEL